jgi:2-polyprenyl-6-methoxyphenol hydroxylase-like FAD-dependent oxidoreductase
MSTPASFGKSIVIVGGGLSGTLCALHIAARRHDHRLIIVDKKSFKKTFHGKG